MDRPQSVTRALANMVGAAIAFAFLNVGRAIVAWQATGAGLMLDP